MAYLIYDKETSTHAACNIMPELREQLKAESIKLNCCIPLNIHSDNIIYIRNYTELHVTQLNSPHYIERNSSILSCGDRPRSR